MKWRIVDLIIAGFAAALCAALLVAAMKANDRNASRSETAGSAVVAKRDLPAMAVITNEDVEKHALPAGQMVEGALGDPAQVIGKVLAAPLLKGEAFTTGCFASQGRGFHLASALPEGMRAVNLSLTNHGGLQNILYPGSVVDVIATFKAAAEGSDQGKYVSMTLLQAVQVLAVENRTVASEDTSEDPTADSSSSSVGRMRRQTVTLMVTPEQAEAIQLAEDRGTISLTLRNPMATESPKVSPMAFNELTEKWIARAPVPAYYRPAEKGPETSVELAPAQWETIIIRGTETERCMLPLPQ
jgi:pilus assembly protein CpaB